MHGDEIQFVFGNPIPSNSGNTQSERVLSQKIIKYWSNFARFSNPNGNGSSDSANLENWPLFKLLQPGQDSNQSKAYLNLNADRIYVDYSLRADYCVFWNYLIPSLKSQISKTSFIIIPGIFS
jgi:acetylcholinesterase